VTNTLVRKADTPARHIPHIRSIRVCNDTEPFISGHTPQNWQGEVEMGCTEFAEEGSPDEEVVGAGLAVFGC
jgi:hypothetical protein